MTELRLRYGQASGDESGEFIVQSARVAACDARTLHLRPVQPAPCISCHGSAACRARQAVRPLQQIAIGHAVDAGDLISLTIGSAQLARMSLLAYLLPPVGMLAGAGLAGLMTPAAGDGWAFMGSIAGLMLSGAVLRLYDSRGGSGSWRVEPGFQKPGPGPV